MTLSSDRPFATFTEWKRMQFLINKLEPNQIKEFDVLSNTIGATIIWPNNRINGAHTINAERGLNSKIADRMDITLECIRLYYLDKPSPLFETFKRYKDFFDLFVDFRGYVDFFLFQDFVSDDYKTVKIAPPFDNFKSSPVPHDVDEYVKYMNFTIGLIDLRNNRINKLIC